MCVVWRYGVIMVCVLYYYCVIIMLLLCEYDMSSVWV